VTVTLTDANGNVATGYRGTIHFTSSDARALLPADYTFGAADAGKHTFTGGVTFKTSGSQSLTATDTVNGALTGKATVSVSAAAAATLSLTAPASAAAGTAFNATVTLTDAYSNVASGYAGTVHFTSSDAKAVLPGDYTFTSADAGTHTFLVTLNTLGSRTITAADSVNSALQASAVVSVVPKHTIGGPADEPAPAAEGPACL
jgi:hypothetical protein